jgi:putative heme-binding domain-containing protein
MFRQSLLEPDAMISPGFGVVSLALDDGRVLSGTLKSETPEQFEVITADGQRHLIPTKSVEERTNPKSPMPPMEKVLSPRDVRDLIEFLAEQK